MEYRAKGVSYYKGEGHFNVPINAQELLDAIWSAGYQARIAGDVGIETWEVEKIIRDLVDNFWLEMNQAAEQHREWCEKERN